MPSTPFAETLAIRVADEGFADYVTASDFAFTVSAYADPQLGVPVGQWPLRKVEPYRKCYGIDPDEFAALRDSAHAGVFVAWTEGRAVGHVVVSIKWNGFAHIEELAVDASARCAGVASRLIDVAAFWARKHNLPGIMLETQTNNLAACRLYERCGFVMGGVDHLRYRAMEPGSEESAVFWYLMFPAQ